VNQRSLRRRALCLAALCGGCTGAAPPALRAAALPAAVPAEVPGPVPAAVPVAPDVYVIPGARGGLSGHNLGRIGNAGFIVGEHGVLMVDCGTSYRHGEALLAAVARITDKPVRTVLITHARQEFVFGAGAFRSRGIPIRMHAAAADLMHSRCAGCLHTLNEVLGADAMRGTTMFDPDSVFAATHDFQSIGRPVRVLHFGHSSGPGAVAVLDQTTDTVFAGGLLDNARVPEVGDSRLDGWHAALAALRVLAPRRIVPGHGAVGGLELIDAVQDYLRALERREAQLVEAGTALSEVPDRSHLPAYEAWDDYPVIHRRNAAIVFLRLERVLPFR